MDKKRILEILEGAKDDNGEIPMSLVRKAFEKIEEPCEDAVSRQAVINIINKPVIIKAKEQIEALPSVQTELTFEQIEEYCYKRCLSIVDNALLHKYAQAEIQQETAKRIVGKSRDGMTMWYQCDMCNEPVDEKDTFCSGCGRRFVNERSD